jgi:hypothetical protein
MLSVANLAGFSICGSSFFFVFLLYDSIPSY